ncbi:MAG: phage tail protein [Deltaproteobacteria bacterium]|nr:phage tail protein [Deltaproteobacteria bacterium]MCW5803370.1 phage tail protein [Deltaproteobacteria bacterium]
MTLQKRSYAQGHFELRIDGHATTAYLKSVEGGFSKVSVVDEPIGPHNERIKHSSTVEIDPISIEFGISGAKDILKWIQKSWRKQHMRYSGQITHADFNLHPTFEHEMMDCLITETAFPTLDGSSKEAGFLKCKIQPERTKYRTLPPSESKIKSDLGRKQKSWLPSNFRFTIDGIDDMQYTNKLDGFTVKQGIKKFYTGEDRFPTIEPTKIEFPNLSGTIALAYADKLFKWHEEMVMKGGKDHRLQKSGAIEFLSPDLKQTLFTINLFEIGIANVTIDKSTANTDSIKRVKFELYVGRMDIDGSLGLE